MSLLSPASLKKLTFSHGIIDRAVKVCCAWATPDKPTGKSFSFHTCSQSYLRRMHRLACYDSVATICKLQNYKLSKARLSSLMEGARPLTDKEFIAVGYHSNLSNIYKYCRVMNLNTSVIEQIYFALDQNLHLAKISASFRDKPKLDLSTDVKSQNQLDTLIKNYTHLVATQEYSQLVLAALFTSEFIRLSIFPANNELVGWLILRLLLCHSGQEVVHYVSLEKRILQTWDAYQKALKCAVGDEGNKGTSMVWIEYIFSLVLSLYDDWKEQLDHTHQGKALRRQTTLQAVSNMNRQFTTSELQSQLSDVAAPAVRQVLKELVQQGKLQCSKMGRSLVWQRAKVTTEGTDTSGKWLEGDKVHALRPMQKGDKTRAVIEAIWEMQQQFCFDDLRQRCQGVSEVTIRKVIDKQRRQGTIVCRKKGRSSYWEKNIGKAR